MAFITIPSCVQSNNGTYTYGIEVWGYIYGGDEIHLKWLRLSLFGRHDGVPRGLDYPWSSLIAATGDQTLYVLDISRNFISTVTNVKRGEK